MMLCVARFVYWTDLDNSRPRVERCFMDGTECGPLDIDPSKIREPATITVDPLTGWVYFAETDRDKVFVYYGPTGGHDEFTLSKPHSLHTYYTLHTLMCVDPTPTDVSGLAVLGDYLYWTDRGGSSVSLGRAEKVRLGSFEEVLDTGGLHGILGVDQRTPSSECVGGMGLSE